MENCISCNNSKFLYVSNEGKTVVFCSECGHVRSRDYHDPDQHTSARCHICQEPRPKQQMTQCQDCGRTVCKTENEQKTFEFCKYCKGRNVKHPGRLCPMKPRNPCNYCHKSNPDHDGKDCPKRKDVMKRWYCVERNTNRDKLPFDLSTHHSPTRTDAASTSTRVNQTAGEMYAIGA